MAELSENKRPIIIIKKRAAHAAHHGGAWKVAYADFVTAMMAFFIVLWLMNSSRQIQVAVGGYFKDPTGTSKKVGSNQTGSGENFTLTKDNMPKLKEELQKVVRQIANFDKLKNQIAMTVTSEGLRIELLESSKGTFFQSGKAELNADGRVVLQALAQELGKLPNHISIEGHTDATPYAANRNYGNWELSADRANSARRVLRSSGVNANQISQVRGYADQKLRVPANPLEPSNRRISLIVQYVVKDEDEGPVVIPEAEPNGKAPEPPAADNHPAENQTPKNNAPESPAPSP